MGLKLSELIGAMLMMVIGLALTPVIASGTETASAGLMGTTFNNVTNVTSGTNYTSANSLLGIIPLLYVVIIIGLAITYIVFKVKKD